MPKVKPKFTLTMQIRTCLSRIHTQMQVFFSSLSHIPIFAFQVLSNFPKDRNQNATTRAMPLHEKKVFTLRVLHTHDA